MTSIYSWLSVAKPLKNKICYVIIPHSVRYAHSNRQWILKSKVGRARGQFTKLVISRIYTVNRRSTPSPHPSPLLSNGPLVYHDGRPACWLAGCMIGFRSTSHPRTCVIRDRHFGATHVSGHYNLQDWRPIFKQLNIIIPTQFWNNPKIPDSWHLNAILMSLNFIWAHFWWPAAHLEGPILEMS